MGSLRSLSLALGAAFVSLALVAAEEAQTPNPEPKEDAYQHPVLRVPRLTVPPEFDGKLAANEWAGAAAITGLTSHGLGGVLAPQIQQATFYLAYDDKYLYLAMNSPNPSGKYPVAWCGEPDDYAIHQDDHIEWQICKYDRAKAKERGFGFYKIFVNPFGVTADQRVNTKKGTDNRWATGGQSRCSVSAEAWQLEMSIALESLEEESLDGESWVMQLVRTDPGNQNLAYLGWGPGGWMAWENFAEVVFDPEAGACQLRSLGSLTEGHLDAKIALRGGAQPLDATATIRVTDATGKALYQKTQAAKLPPETARELAFPQRDLPLSVKGNHLWVEVKAREKVLYRSRMRVDRLSADQRKKFVDGWIDRYGDKPPVAVSTSERPDSLLAKMAISRRKLQPLVMEFMKAMKGHKLDQANELCQRMIKEVPFSPIGYYNMACLHALQGQKDDAFRLLEQSIERGYNNVLHLKADPDLHSLHDELRFATLVDKAAAAEPDADEEPAEPFLVRQQIAWVADGNVGRHPQFGLPFATYRFDPAGPGERKITTVGGRAGELLRKWYAEGTAAGNWGDLYDNRDGDHSNMNRVLFPQMTWIEYSKNARDARLHWGLPTSIIQAGVVLGNASVAQTAGPFWRSMPRLAHANQRSADYLYWQYTHNKVYMYPGHVDYPRNEKELKEKKRKDVFPMNSPYLLASRGSSGSDRVFLRAFAATMAAFRPEVKKLLIEKGLLAPTLQSVFRMSNKPVTTTEDYLTGAAHPPVFSGGNINMQKMVTLAHEMTPEALPPVVQLNVVEEDEPVNGRDFFAAPGRTEKLFDTPCAIARVFRGVQQRRRMVVSAEESRDLTGRELTFRWAVLQGDAEAIKIRPVKEDGSVVELSVPYHPRWPIAPESVLESSRVDIGAFAHNDVYFSAPAFITFYSLDNEKREYDDKGRILSVTYTGAKERGNYVDPVIALAKSWRDEYQYGEDGKLAGWTRYRGDVKEEFTAEGERIVRRDEEGKSVETHAVRYLVKPRKPKQLPVIEPTEDEPEDKAGTPKADGQTQ